MLTETNPKLSRLIEATKDKLSGGRSKVPAGFVDDVLANALPEDLVGFTPEQLAGFIGSAYALLKKRRPGRATVRVTSPKFAGNGHHPVTVVEMLNDNMPFLVDSLVGELQEAGAEILFLVHPIVTVERDRSGSLGAYHGLTPPSPDSVAKRESLIQVHVTRIDSDKERDALAARIEEMLGEVRAAVKGWHPMQRRLKQAIDSYMAHAPSLPGEELAEAIAFLEWLLDDNFIFLGMRDYEFIGGDKRGTLHRADLPGLGILSDPDVRVLRRGTELVTTTPELREFLMLPQPLIITKANVHSRVHRRTYMDYIGVKLYDARGSLCGELRIVGLFTSTAFTRSVRSIPYLRRKVELVMQRSGYDHDSHSGKALLNIIEHYPRGELFSIEPELLLDHALQMVRLEERPRVRVLIRRDKFGRFVAALVYVPRDRYNTDVRVRIGEYLAQAYGGHISAYHPSFPEGGRFARVQFIIGAPNVSQPAPDQATLEAAVGAIVRTWLDGFELALDAEAGEDADRFLARYRNAFSSAYRENFDPHIAARDVGVIERLSPEHPIAIDFYRASADRDARVRLKIFHYADAIALSMRVPMMENMGFNVINERTYQITPEGRDLPYYLHDMTLESAGGGAIDLVSASDRLEEGLLAVWRGEAESDGFNGLIMNAALDWRDVALVRAFARYLQQTGTPFSQDYKWATLNRHAGIARLIVELFKARFDPARRAKAESERIEAEINARLENVSILDEDRILRRFVNVVTAMLRTNFFQPAPERSDATVISFKLDSGNVDELPLPHPYREIFVYSPRVEAIHLRFGPVARGGIRWSDRPQDFRTEVLGLAKAQNVKNAVIVPLGAKGGYVPKQLPAAGRDEIFAEGKAAYRIFVDSLLDLTDNLVDGKIVHPKGVVRYDDADPYLVVAADKGTATFSDTANGLAEAHDFWLDDAFASGGSAGYDHKEMAITARGAWEAVKRHFRELDVDIQATPFTVAGVGDMSGDVFGNGMLQSRRIRLVAAFDHRDIFIDPAPDPEKSFAERERLFALPRSTWQDYDKALISSGGGVFPRSLKSVPLSDSMKQLLGLTGRTATPAELISAILKADIDLLWFGGIGTYVRAEDEPNTAIGDRANDALRITGKALRARVVGEGANLAMTQLARVEYALAGGRCNSDAIDNSAGVNCSDIEVNIKIALRAAELSGKLSRPKRNRLLVSMTEDVAALVLRNNYLQTLAISLTERLGLADMGYQQQLMQDLEWRGLLDRQLEALPDDAEMAERREDAKPLTRSEIGVLLAYAKLVLFDELVASDVPDDPALEDVELFTYFPVPMRKAYGKEIRGHKLRREIAATQLANSMINRGGPAFVVRMAERVGATPAEVARAFLATRIVFDLVAINRAIDGLDNKMSGKLQLEMYAAAQETVLAGTVWFLRYASFADGIGTVIKTYGKGVESTAGLLAETLPPSAAARVAGIAASYIANGVPEDLARRVAALPELVSALDIALVADLSGRPFRQALTAYFAVAGHFRILLLDTLADRLSLADHYDFLALDSARRVLADAHRAITVAVLAASPGRSFDLQKWIAPQAREVAHVVALLTRMTETEELTVSRVAVAADTLAELARG